jgi:hypothetical protein
MAFGAGVGRSDAAARSSARGGGVFSGFGVSSSFRADLDFPAFLVLRETSFSWDFFDFGFGVGVWRRFDFDETLGSGVSRGVGFGVTSSSSSDSFASFALRGRGDSCASALSSLVDSSFAAFALGMVFFCDSSFANFA